MVVKEAKDRQVPMRIGVNVGSLESRLIPELMMLEGDEKVDKTAAAMVESALDHVKILEDMDFTDIKISLKASDVPTTILAYQLIADRVEYPLHLGITEAGTLKAGMVKSAVGAWRPAVSGHWRYVARLVGGRFDGRNLCGL